MKIEIPRYLTILDAENNVIVSLDLMTRTNIGPRGCKIEASDFQPSFRDTGSSVKMVHANTPESRRF